jgi:hypothetical protein
MSDSLTAAETNRLIAKIAVECTVLTTPGMSRNAANTVTTMANDLQVIASTLASGYPLNRRHWLRYAEIA